MKYYKISEYLYLVIGSVILVDLVLFKDSITDNLPLLFSVYYLFQCICLEDITELSSIKGIKINNRLNINKI